MTVRELKRLIERLEDEHGNINNMDVRITIPSCMSGGDPEEHDIDIVHVYEDTVWIQSE